MPPSTTQSYAGGRDLFGLATDPAKLEKRGFQVPIFNDGLLEVFPTLDSLVRTQYTSRPAACSFAMVSETPMASVLSCFSGGAAGGGPEGRVALGAGDVRAQPPARGAAGAGAGAGAAPQGGRG